jgi:hypothetical protein
MLVESPQLFFDRKRGRRDDDAREFVGRMDVFGDRSRDAGFLQGYKRGYNA